MDLLAWLARLGLEQHAEAFEQNAIDVEVLPELTDADLKELGIARMGDRKRATGVAIHRKRIGDWGEAGRLVTGNEGELEGGASVGRRIQQKTLGQVSETLEDPRSGLGDIGRPSVGSRGLEVPDSSRVLASVPGGVDRRRCRSSS